MRPQPAFQECLAVGRGSVGALHRAGNPDVTTRVLPGLNHLLQPCRTCLPAEYNDLDTTLSPEALRTVGDWLDRHLHSGKQH